MIYFTADTHFGHANIIKYCNRPFQSLEEMNETMLAKWNGRVHENDTVYILGDLFFGAVHADFVKSVLQELKGEKHLILGNHDIAWMQYVDLNQYFVSVNSYLEITTENGHLALFHYPQLCWNQPLCSYMIHGHIHNNCDMDYWPLLQVRENVLNAGVEINGYAPVTFVELLENNRCWKVQSLNSAAKQQ